MSLTLSSSPGPRLVLIRRAVLTPAVFVLLAVTGLLPLACRGDALSGERPEENLSSDPDSPLNSKEADLLFFAESIPTFTLTLPEEEWEALKKNAAAEEYTEATLSFEGEDMGVVGLRFKGGYGSLYACVDEQGNLLCPKLSMKLKFDKYYSDKRFYGMKRLNLHSMVRDATKLHDKISYGLYRDSGVIAPRSHWAVVEVNGESLGVYATVEQIDGRFSADRWPDDKDGNVYKEVWPMHDDPQVYQDALETNETTATHERMLAFAAALEGATAEEALAALDEFSDTDNLYAYMAVQDAIVNWDGITAWYCGEWGCSNHNFYWYVEEISGKVTLVPWDLDSTLNPAAPLGHVPHWTLEPEDCGARYDAFGTTEVMAPGCTPFFQGLRSDYDRYAAAIEALIAGPFELEKVRADIDEYRELLRPAIEADPTMQGTAGWEADVDLLKSDLELLHERLHALMNGMPLTAFGIAADSVSDFEEVSSLSLTLGSALYAAPSTSALHGLSTDFPLGGAQDLLLDFTFRDEPSGGFNQWVSLALLMTGGVVDLSAYSGLRFDLIAEGPREVRVDLDSFLESGRDQGIRPGWNISATSEVQTFTLHFEELAVPVWATDPGDDLARILASVSGLVLQPQVNGRNADGQLGADVSEEGFLQIDNIEFF